jgi:hypothetical protein
MSVVTGFKVNLPSNILNINEGVRAKYLVLVGPPTVTVHAENYIREPPAQPPFNCDYMGPLGM